MKQRKMLALTLYQLGQLYHQELPELVAAAEASLRKNVVFSQMRCKSNRIF